MVAFDRPENTDSAGRRDSPHPPDSPQRPEGRAVDGADTPTPSQAADLPDRATYRAEYKKAVEAEYRAYAIDQGCERVEKTEKEIVTPGMRRIEGEDPERHLVGLEFRLKGKDRLSEKVMNHMRANPDISYDNAFSKVKDAIRYTFQYADGRYAQGVYSDIERLAARFERVEQRNSWRAEEYKGINSWWRVPESGQLFEVQFHTEASYRAKQETHGAYEKLRMPDTPKAERDALDDYQRKVSARIPIPDGATDIPDYP